jgi:hypothetical protein
MLKIEEDDNDTNDDHMNSLIPPKRVGAYSPYQLDNGSQSSLGGYLNQPGNRSSITSLKYVPPMTPRNKSPVRSSSPRRSPSPKRNPFNFKSTNLDMLPLPKTSHRKGHRYKHSSVSMNLFQEPKQRAPLRINISYPVPTLKEFISSCDYTQKLKSIWFLIHLLSSISVFLLGFIYSNQSMTTLSHLIFYDSLGMGILVISTIMTNFDIYSKSSLKFPFGLGRIDVLFKFAKSISLIFVGCDLASHFIEEMIMSLFNDHDHHGHMNHLDGHEMSTLCYELIMIGVGGTTMISYKMTKSQSSIVTMIFILLLILQPFIPYDNDLSTLLISSLIIYMGSLVVKSLAYVILLSHPSTASLADKITSQLKTSSTLENVIVSQIHMDLIIVMISIKMIGCSDDEELELRLKLEEMVKESVKGHVEITVDIKRL